ncbi:hypothetical protein Dsin_023583 [Dipteronia sinensis]|uniref:HMA domain-containing protein n=1 Tax=Dipteronia sinensis TaxID=43782 RepID=A0AAE0E0X2_9ROSI|nr:hypothetical protein Dsin_023583 [Dipteronia sinensis]
MKQKIVIRVQMPCEKCRSKAMKIAVTKDGVTKVEIQGKEKDELVVIGNEVDSVRLARSLRKKLHSAYILSVEEEKEKKEKDDKKDDKIELIPYTCYPNHVYGIPQAVCYDQDPSFCSIM